MSESNCNQTFKNAIKKMNNETLINFYKEIIIYNNKDLEPFLKDISYLIDLDSIIDGTEIFLVSIFYEDKTSFKIFLERGIDINKKMTFNCDEYYDSIYPLLIALNKNNIYFIYKILDIQNLDLFLENLKKKNRIRHRINTISYLCEYTDNLSLFIKVLNNMISKSKIKVYEMISNRHETFIEDCLLCYKKNNNKNLLFNKLEILINLDKKINNDLSKIYFFERVLNEYDLSDISVELYLFLDKNLKQVKLNNPVFKAVEQNDMKLLKFFHREGYTLEKRYIYTPLNKAIINDSFEIVKFLVENGVKVNDTKENLKKKYFDNLFFSIVNDNLQMFKYISKYFNIFQEYQIPDKVLYLPLYFRPIHIAMVYKSFNIISYLLEHGECLYLNGNCSYTPLKSGIKNGINDLEINLLTVKTITLSESLKENKDSLKDKCSICLDILCNDEIVKLKCGHLFHKKCFIKCIENNHFKNCPYCRQDIVLDSLIKPQLGIISKKKNIKKPRRNSLNLFEKKHLNNIEYIDDINIESLEIELFNPNKSKEKWNEKNKLLCLEIENNNRNRNLEK